MSRPRPRGMQNCVSSFAGVIQRNLLTVLTLIGVLGGTGLGVLLKTFPPNGDKWTPRQLSYIEYPGTIFLNMLKCLIVPLLVSSITSAIGSLDINMSGKIALRAITYYFTTTISAVILGIALVASIRPGRFASVPDKNDTSSVPKNVLTVDTLLDLTRNMFPPNIIQATVSQFQTKLVRPTEHPHKNYTLEEYKMVDTWSSSTNVLGLVMFSIVLGITIGRMRESGKILQDFFIALSHAMMSITSWVIWISPLGVFFLVTTQVTKMESLADTVGSLGLYFATVMLGLFCHGFGTIPVIFFLCTRRMAYPYIAKMFQVLVTAFGTGSSSATMPVTIQRLDEIGIDPRVTRFVIPVGATINMDGTALYEAVAALFIAQVRQVPYSFGTIVGVSITATAASIGAAGIPQAGLVTMVMVLETVGLPAQDVSMILAVDWLLDRFRTTINVMCDALGAIIVNSLSQKDLKDIEDKASADPHELVELHDGKE